MKFSSAKVGIDLGTTNTLVYLPGEGVVLNEPSVVAVNKYGGKVLAVGREASTMVGKTPGDIVAYRPMRNGVIADYRVTEAMLAYFIDRALPSWNLFKPDVVVSVPAGVTSTEKRAVVEAALKAGARNAYVVKEPILAALGAGIPINKPEGHMVVDIGGGTTDAAVISLGGIVASQSVKHGGTSLDGAIVEYVKNKHNLHIGERSAEDVKISIGSAVPVDDEVSMELSGQALVSGLPETIEIKTNEVVKAIHHELIQIIDAIRRVLQDTPPEIASDIVDQGITLTGGTSLLRNLPIRIKKEIGVTARVTDDTKLCVVKGTGVILEHLPEYKRRLLSK